MAAQHLISKNNGFTFYWYAVENKKIVRRSHCIFESFLDCIANGYNCCYKHNQCYDVNNVGFCLLLIKNADQGEMNNYVINSNLVDKNIVIVMPIGESLVRIICNRLVIHTNWNKLSNGKYEYYVLNHNKYFYSKSSDISYVVMKYSHR